MAQPDNIIKLLQLEPHPEGGYYKETFRDADQTSNGRSASSLIYFLLKSGNVSHLHRLDAAEVWHFYDGDALEVIELAETGPIITTLGRDLASGQRPQYFVGKDRWFGARVKEGGSWTLVGCSVAPAFTFDAFEIGKRSLLLKEFESCAEVIEALTEQD